MAHKEFISLIEQNLMALDWLGDRLRNRSVIGAVQGDIIKLFEKYSRPQIQVLVRLHVGGRALLKDIARRESVPAANLCVAFRKLESDGLVIREIDENDRRNTWYSVSKSGAEIANQAMAVFRVRIAELFADVGKDDEVRLTGALREINNILNKLKENKSEQ